MAHPKGERHLMQQALENTTEIRAPAESLIPLDDTASQVRRAGDTLDADGNVARPHSTFGSAQDRWVDTKWKSAARMQSRLERIGPVQNYAVGVIV
jgi:hypothetical protein